MRKDGGVWRGGFPVTCECEQCGEWYRDVPLARWTREEELTPHAVRVLVEEDPEAPRGAFWLFWYECPECEYPEYDAMEDPVGAWGPWEAQGAGMRAAFLLEEPFTGFEEDPNASNR
jgi:hypothetical protein